MIHQSRKSPVPHLILPVIREFCRGKYNSLFGLILLAVMFCVFHIDKELVINFYRIAILVCLVESIVIVARILNVFLPSFHSGHPRIHSYR